MEFNVHFGEIIKTYNNMFEDGTWKREIGEKDVIVALSTKVVELQAKLETQDKRVVALATQAKKEQLPTLLPVPLVNPAALVVQREIPFP